MSNSNVIKPIAMAGCVIVGDKFILGESDMNRSLYIAGAGAAGVYAAGLLAPMLPLDSMLPDGSFTDSKTLELRLVEMGGAVGVGYVVYRYVLNNDPYINIQTNKLLLLAGADFVAEYIDDYLAGRPLSFFK
jgi:hypothetical protein